MTVVSVGRKISGYRYLIIYIIKRFSSCIFSDFRNCHPSFVICRGELWCDSIYKVALLLSEADVLPHRVCTNVFTIAALLVKFSDLCAFVNTNVGHICLMASEYSRNFAG
jgi:hypothetical protein